MTETRVPSGIIVNFPGGGVELGESPVAALEREFVEETQLKVSVGELLYVTKGYFQNTEYPTEQLIHMYYQVNALDSGVPTSGTAEDVSGIIWASLDDIKTLPIVPTDAEFLRSKAFQDLW